MTEKKKILEELLLKEEDVATLVNKIKTIMKIDEHGRPFFLVSEKTITAAERLGIYLIARYFAHELGKAEKKSMSLQELAQLSGTNYDITKTRVREMNNQRLVKKTKSGKTVEYAITNTGISTIADRINGKIK